MAGGSALVRDAQAFLAAGADREAAAEAFLARHTLQDIYEYCSEHGGESDAVRDVVAAVDRLMFSTTTGSQLLPSSSTYAVAALAADNPKLRRLGCKMLGGTLQGSDVAERSNSASMCRLVATLADADTGIAAEAEAALRQLASTDAGTAHSLASSPHVLQRLQGITASTSAVVRLRGLNFVAYLAGQSQEAMHQLQAQGLLDSLLKELSNTSDLLSCMTGLQVIADILKDSSATTASALAELLLPALLHLLRSPESMLQSQALEVMASVVSSAYAGSSAGASVGELASHLLVRLNSILDPAGMEDFPQEVEVGAANAAGCLCRTPEGSALLLTHSSAVGQSLAQRALSRRGSRDLRCAALWALAGAAGLHASPDWLGSNPEAEAGLREAVFAAAQANVGDPSPAEVLLSFLHQPVEDLRVATYGLLTALVGRIWGAAEMCRKAELLDRLCSPDSEAAPEACKWRFTTLQALHSTLQQGENQPAENGISLLQAAIFAAAPQINAAVQQGVYGMGGTSHRPAVEDLMG